MAKKVVSSVPIHKQKLTKRDNKKKVVLKLKKVLDFLKSDNYMFAPLVSSQTSDDVFTSTTNSTGEYGSLFLFFFVGTGFFVFFGMLKCYWCARD